MIIATYSLKLILFMKISYYPLHISPSKYTLELLNLILLFKKKKNLHLTSYYLIYIHNMCNYIVFEFYIFSSYSLFFRFSEMSGDEWGSHMQNYLDYLARLHTILSIILQVSAMSDISHYRLVL